MRRTIALPTVFAVLMTLAWVTVPAAKSQKTWRWYKGNLHTHTINSDGDSSPDAVARWYKEHRYQFLALTDHNYFTDPQGLNSVLAADERFLLLRGEEVTSKFESSAVHVNAFGLRSTIAPAFGPDLVSTIQQNVDLIRQANAVPSLNHPNFRWSVRSPELKRIDNLKLFEVYNGHPGTNDLGGGGEESLEAMWDIVLSSGKRIYGIGVDDAHSFKELGPTLSNPGRGWIQVKADSLNEESLLQAIEAGEFYASTGVVLSDVVRSPTSLRVQIEAAGDAKFTVRFTGRDGKLLSETFENPAEYAIRPGDGYVRATVTDSNGLKAWTQPVFEAD